MFNFSDEDSMIKNWIHDARCQSLDADFFFPPTQDRRRAVTIARSYCRECVVRRECACFALNNRIGAGVYAGVYLGDGGQPSPHAVQMLKVIADRAEAVSTAKD